MRPVDCFDSCVCYLNLVPILEAVADYLFIVERVL